MPKNRILRWLAITAASIVGLLMIAAGGVYAMSQSKLNQTYTVAAEDFEAPMDSATVERGRHLVQSVSACVGCHGMDLGGKQMIDEPAFAVVAAANLTRGTGGVAAQYTSDALWERAIRHGIGADGRTLIIMPAQHYNNLADDDLRAIIAYVKSVPPVNSDLKPFSAGPVSRVLMTMNKLPIFPASQIEQGRPHRAAPPAAVDATYGEYVSRIAACRECHGMDLKGAQEPGAAADSPPTPNLTNLRGYDEAGFVNAIRTGIRPSGAPIDSTRMPWVEYRGMNDTELRALWTYLQSIR